MWWGTGGNSASHSNKLNSTNLFRLPKVAVRVAAVKQQTKTTLRKLKKRLRQIAALEQLALKKLLNKDQQEKLDGKGEVLLMLQKWSAANSLEKEQPPTTNVTVEQKQPPPSPSTLTITSFAYLSTHLIVPYFINAQGEIKRPEHLISWWSRIFSFYVPDEKDRIELRFFCRLFRDALKPPPLWTTFPHPNYPTLNELIKKLHMVYQQDSTKAPKIVFVAKGTFQNNAYYNIDINYPLKLIGDGRTKTFLSGFNFTITGTEEERSVVSVVLSGMTMKRGGVCGRGGLLFLCKDMTIVGLTHCDGVIAKNTKGRLINCVITQCERNGIFCLENALIELEGDQTKVDGNNTNGDGYGLHTFDNSCKIHLLYPLTKESVSTNNHGGKNYRKCAEKYRMILQVPAFDLNGIARIHARILEEQNALVSKALKGVAKNAWDIQIGQTGRYCDEQVTDEFEDAHLMQLVPRLLRKFANLTSLRFRVQKIHNMGPLAELVNLTTLELNNNPLSNLAPLAALVNLTKLNLKSNRIVDVGTLAALVNLTYLDLERNQVVDVAPLASLVNLEYLSMSANQVVDVTPLRFLVDLRKLYLNENQVVDVTSLASLVNLEYLDLNSNHIVDVTSLAPLINLRYLLLRSNQIVDVAPLVSLVNLRRLWVNNNPIVDVSPLAALVNLSELYCHRGKVPYDLYYDLPGNWRKK